VMAPQQPCMCRAAPAAGGYLRVGGAEFVALPPGADGDAARMIVAEARRDLRSSMVFGDLSPVVGASIGVALFPDDGEDPGSLISMADARTYSASWPAGPRRPRPRREIGPRPRLRLPSAGQARARQLRCPDSPVRSCPHHHWCSSALSVPPVTSSASSSRTSSSDSWKLKIPAFSSMRSR